MVDCFKYSIIACVMLIPVLAQLDPAFGQTERIQLGDYIKLAEYPKSHNVKLRIKPPAGWNVEEGIRPNTVLNFNSEGRSILIQVRENLAFVSRREAQELFSDRDIVNSMVKSGFGDFDYNLESEPKVTSIDNYPAILYNIEAEVERSGMSMKVTMLNCNIMYEDFMVIIQYGAGSNMMSETDDMRFKLVLNSIVFDEQYEW
jgi:hypothetical protein